VISLHLGLVTDSTALLKEYSAIKNIDVSKQISELEI
jgi:hypothetical protein